MKLYNYVTIGILIFHFNTITSAAAAEPSSKGPVPYDWKKHNSLQFLKLRSDRDIDVIRIDPSTDFSAKLKTKYNSKGVHFIGFCIAIDGTAEIVTFSKGKYHLAKIDETETADLIKSAHVEEFLLKKACPVLTMPQARRLDASTCLKSGMKEAGISSATATVMFRKSRQKATALVTGKDTAHP